MQRDIETIQGDLCAQPDWRFGLVAGRFNHFVVDSLVQGACDCLQRHGADLKSCVLVQVPGAWEIPWAAQQLVRNRRVDAVIALGAVIRGATPHFDVVVAQCTAGLSRLCESSAVPVTLGLLTTDSVDQAIERAGTKAGNKGWDAAAAALELLSLSPKLAAKPATADDR